MPSKDDNPDLSREIGRRLVDLRKKRGLTQTGLAKMLGINQTGISKYERGEVRLTPSAIVKLAEVLDTSADHLLGLRSRRGR